MNRSAGLLDAGELATWRDALVAGGLPQPERARFQPLRAGVVNLWEYEVAEYWLADGRAQFVGRNESGKSTLMTLTTLILLAGDTSPHLIDTLGTSNKRFRYYVEPDGSDEDRRDPSTSTNRGWAWIEFGRVVDGQAVYITALLYANVKRARQAPQLTWVVCEGPARVRRGITLARGPSVVPPADACDDPGWSTYPSGTGYRQHLARSVFDAPPQRLDDYVRMLKVIRTPKLGSRLNTAFLREKLREALPPLAEHEVAQLADGWEELEKIAVDRDSAEEARQAVDAFRRRVWWPWAAAEVRRAADTLSAANNALDDVTRNAREAETALHEAERDLGRVVNEINATGSEHRRVTAEHDELRDSQRFKEAETAVANAKSLAERAEEMRDVATARREEAGKARRHADELKGRLEQSQGKLRQARAAFEAGVETTAVAARSLGINQAKDWLDDQDIDRVEVARSHREEAATRLQALVAAAITAAKEAERAQTTFDGVREAAEAWRRKATGAREAAEAEAQAVVDGLSSWCASLDQPPERDLVERWLTGVHDVLTAPRPAPGLGAAVANGYLTPRRVTARTLRQGQQERAERHRDRAAQLDEEITSLREADDPVGPGPQGWTRRQRPEPSPAGAPLWRLLDPAADTTPDVVDHIEAVLAAAGLLDLWVNPDGSWSSERDGLDAVLEPGTTAASQSLRSVLQVSDEAAGGLRDVAQRFLDTVSWSTAGDALGTTPVAISTDGRWRTPVASGQVGPKEGGASLLGTAARRRWVEREIVRLESERRTELDRAERAEAQIVAVDQMLDRLDAWEMALPGDSDLVGLVLDARDAQARLDETEQRLAQVRTELDEAVGRADDARSEAATWAAGYALPIDAPRLSELVTGLRSLAVTVEKLRSLERAFEGARDAVTVATGDAERAAADAAEAETRQRQAGEAAIELEHRAATARRLLTGEIADVLDQVSQLAAAIKALNARRERLNETKVDLSVARANARNTLADREKDAEAARHARDAATDAWWDMVDHGPAQALGLQLPANRSFTAALDLARSARASIRPPKWPERDRDAHPRIVEAAWRKLVNETITLRAVLEASAGRTVRIVEAADDGPPRVEIVVDGTGQGYEPPQANVKLAEQHQELRQAYDENMHKTLHELLGSTFIEHLRDRLEEVSRLHTGINRVLADHPTGTTRTMLRVQRAPADGDPHAAHVLKLLEGSSYTYLTPDAQEEVRRFLQLRIDEAREAAQAAGDLDWRERLAEALDYRRWFDTVVEKRSGDKGRWGPLTTGAHGRLSGGASVVTLMLPLVATLAAMYASTPQGPRLLWLDEAFDGVDKDNRVSILRLLKEFDMDYLLAGPVMLVNVATVPSAAVWDVIRAEHPEPGVALMASLWVAGALHMLDVPDGAELVAQPSSDLAADDQLDLLGSTST